MKQKLWEARIYTSRRMGEKLWRWEISRQRDGKGPYVRVWSLPAYSSRNGACVAARRVLKRLGLVERTVKTDA